MHMADALLSPTVGLSLWAATCGIIVHASRKLKQTMDEKVVPLMGVLGAFVFAAQMINFTIPATGSSGHIGGGMILSIALGPHAAFLAMASVLSVQALFFADGGLLALGCNIWNLAFYPCFLAYPLIYAPLAGDGNNGRRVLLASLVAAIVSLQLGAFSVVLETVYSGRSELPFGAFVALMQPVHLAIGIVEGLVTGWVILFVQKTRPEVLRSVAASEHMEASISLRRLVVALGVLALLTGAGLSRFSSTLPDGLEWSIEKITGAPELPDTDKESGPGSALKAFQERTALLPDYGSNLPDRDAGASISGMVGAAIVFVAILLTGALIRFVRRKRA